MKDHQRPDLLPDLSGEEALLLARLLDHLARAIWCTYAADVDLERAHRDGLLDTLALPIESLPDDDDLPF